MGSKNKIQAKPEREKQAAKNNSKLKTKRAKPSVKSASRKRAADAELFKAVVEHSHDAVVFLNRERKVAYVSPSVTRITGYESEELIGKYGMDFVHPDDQETTTRN